MFAEIASGNVDTADVMFLIATILFALATIAALVPLLGGRRTPPEHAGGPPWATAPLGPALIAAGLCLAALGWLVL